MPKARRINHLNLTVADLDRSLRFYRQVFGLELRYRGPSQLVLTTAASVDALALQKSDGSKAPGPGGMQHFGFELESSFDLDDAIREVERCGGRLVERSTRGPAGGPVAYVADPDGYVIQLDVNSLSEAWRQRPVVAG